MPNQPDNERSLAVFIDLENLALGVQDRQKSTFDIGKVLERLVEKGKLIVKKAYADWSRFPQYAAAFHESAIELIEIPKRSQTGKNSADIRLVVDAMDLAWSKSHIDTFVIVSGDSDFSPLASKLKENGKHVIGLGMRDSTSSLLRDNCDEFIYYEDLKTDQKPHAVTHLETAVTEEKREAFSLLLDALAALRRENIEMLYASMIKDTMKRKMPSFSENYYGFRSFTHLLEEAKKLKLVDLERDARSRMYVVTRFSGDGDSPTPAPSPASPPASPNPRRRRR